MSRYRVGVDIGGTFTDFAVFDKETGVTTALKSPTVRHDPVDGVVTGLRILAEERGVSPEEVGYFVHGATIAVNTLIERDGARLGMLVTRGFGDMLIIQRLRVPVPQYWYGSRTEPLIPREHIFEVDERMLADGREHQPLCEADIAKALKAARRLGLEGLVVCFLHAFRNPAHEAAARAFIEREADEFFVCCSHEIWPRMREYERAIIAIVNAYVMPRVAGYLGKLEESVRAVGIKTVPYITQSNGGVMTAKSAQQVPAETLLSGPAAGVIGAVQVAGQMEIKNLITLDIGGTSADVAFVEDGRPQISQSEHVANFPIMMPVVGVSSIGAGGGSVVWLDDAGVLKIGPQSVGSDPGPACYGKGNERPALTDAFLVGGFLNPDTFAGGRVKLRRDLAEKALEGVANGLGTTIRGAVEGIVMVTVASLYAELSNLAAQRGTDVRDYALVSFGGAGSLVACRLAAELGVRRVIVPRSPGTLSALGALSADVAGNFVTSLSIPLTGSERALAEAYARLEADAEAWLKREAAGLDSYEILLSADMRYVGQSFEVDVAIQPDWIRESRIDAIAEAFHARHRRVYAHADSSVAVEIVDLRLLIAGATPKPSFPPLPRLADSQAVAPAGERFVYTEGVEHAVPVWRREELLAGQDIAGPALVDQADTTVFLPPDWSGVVHESGSLLLERHP